MTASGKAFPASAAALALAIIPSRSKPSAAARRANVLYTRPPIQCTSYAFESAGVLAAPAGTPARAGPDTYENSCLYILAFGLRNTQLFGAPRTGRVAARSYFKEASRAHTWHACSGHKHEKRRSYEGELSRTHRCERRRKAWSLKSSRCCDLCLELLSSAMVLPASREPCSNTRTYDSFNSN